MALRSLSLLVVTLLVFAFAFAFASVNGIGSSTFDRLSETITMQHVVTGGCVDVKPKGSEQYTCAQQKAWGKCSASWMKGYCKKSCGTCGGQTLAPAGSHTPTGGQDSLAALNINALPSRTAPMKSYGAIYASRKKAIVSALQKVGFSPPQVKMMLAIAMLETNTFHPDQRDKKKTGDSTNYSQWNLNRDMLERGGVKLDGLNDWGHLNETAAALKKLLTKYGVNGFLNYLRGGYTGWKDGRSYGCVPYRTGIASIIKMIDQNPLLMSDDRRIDMVVQHV